MVSLSVSHSRRPETFSLSCFPSPWWPPAPASSASLAVASDVAPPQAAAPPVTVSAPLPSGPYSIGVGVVLASLNPPAVSSSPSDAKSSVSYLLHLAMLAALSSVSVLPTCSSSPYAVLLVYALWVLSSPPPPALR